MYLSGKKSGRRGPNRHSLVLKPAIPMSGIRGVRSKLIRHDRTLVHYQIVILHDDTGWGPPSIVKEEVLTGFQRDVKCLPSSFLHGNDLSKGCGGYGDVCECGSSVIKSRYLPPAIPVGFVTLVGTLPGPNSKDPRAVDLDGEGAENDFFLGHNVEDYPILDVAGKRKAAVGADCEGAGAAIYVTVLPILADAVSAAVWNGCVPASINGITSIGGAVVIIVAGSGDIGANSQGTGVVRAGVGVVAIEGHLRAHSLFAGGHVA